MTRSDLLEIVAIASLLGCTIVLAGIWMAAAATGNSLTVTVNEYGERTPELVMWTLVVPIIAYALHKWATRPR
ncbi:hypothetical protein [Haloarcula laminariae]|uniref:hypothetical protein n=1 Tax=Haloarcula laminariae TaxID=2961577 RepID=UPI0024054FCF|nr:hypothetical protein [Halomicroarcula sp. FL173]